MSRPRIIDFTTFVINRRPHMQISSPLDELLVWEEIDAGLIRGARSPNLKLVVVANAGPFEHSSNVLRKSLAGTNCMALMGVGSAAALFAEAESISIVVRTADVLATCDERTLKFNLCDLGGANVAEPIEMIVRTNEVCYKPDYFYTPELGRIIANGFMRAGRLWDRDVSTRLAGDGRVWTSGLGMPKELCQIVSGREDWYFARIAEYISILRTLLDLRSLTGRQDALVAALEEHFAYSTLFSFIVQHLMMDYQLTAGNVALEDALERVAAESPLGRKRELTEPSLARLLMSINAILDGLPGDASALTRAMGWDSEPVPSPLFNVMFVSCLISDIRRAVINTLIEESDWFRSICVHRRLADIF